MRKHASTPPRCDRYVTLAATSPPGAAQGRFVGGHQPGLAGCKLPPLLKSGASSCSSQRQREREPWGTSRQPSAPMYLPTCVLLCIDHRNGPLVAVAARHKGLTAESVARQMIHDWVKVFGTPKAIYSINGSHLTSA